ncbi:hypothetical protein E2C01_066624 [Portunus trituberculatus]|uniref:Post-SET domain-containing protein n=1 Tax=Portunus trituberculatus TaxID=210409 RepID=A0A5B7HQA4_PORTR|nr:hypothetical protein [Portunus trituberculatus]
MRHAMLGVCGSARQDRMRIAGPRAAEENNAAHRDAPAQRQQQQLATKGGRTRYIFTTNDQHSLPPHPPAASCHCSSASCRGLVAVMVSMGVAGGCRYPIGLLGPEEGWPGQAVVACRLML